MTTRPLAALSALLLLSATADPATAAGRWDDVQPLKLPVVEEVRLDNGLLVLLYENHQIPLAVFDLVMKTGALQDPAGKEGLADMTADLLTYGTTSRTEEQIADAVDFLGASLGASASQHSMKVAGNVTTVDPDNLRTFFDLLTDITRNPTFTDEAIAKVKQQKKGALAALRDDNASLAYRAMAQFGFEGHPLGRSVLGYPATIDAIGREDLVDFHRQYFVPEQAILGIAGDVDRDQIIAWAKEKLGDSAWGRDCDAGDAQCTARICRPGKVPQTCEQLCLHGQCEANRTLDPPPPPKRDGWRIVLVDKADPTLNQVQWQLGEPGIVKTGDPDWFAWRLGTQVLGGDFTARINQLLRVKEGLTYGANLRVAHDPYQPGNLAVTTFVKPKDLARAVELAAGELRRAVTEPIGVEELDSFKSKLIESQPFRFETPISILDEILALRRSDMPDSFLEQYPVRIAAVTPEQALAALKRGLRVDELVLVAIGNADMADELARLLPEGKGTVEVVPVDALFEPPK